MVFGVCCRLFVVVWCWLLIVVWLLFVSVCVGRCALLSVGCMLFIVFGDCCLSLAV